MTWTDKGVRNLRARLAEQSCTPHSRFLSAQPFTCKSGFAGEEFVGSVHRELRACALVALQGQSEISNPRASPFSCR